MLENIKKPCCLAVNSMETFVAVFKNTGQSPIIIEPNLIVENGFETNASGTIAIFQYFIRFGFKTLTGRKVLYTYSCVEKIDIGNNVAGATCRQKAFIGLDQKADLKAIKLATQLPNAQVVLKNSVVNAIDRINCGAFKN